MEIRIEPNYRALFAMFLREAKLAGERALAEDGAGTLRTLQAVLAPLNVAIQSATTLQDIEAYREALADLVKQIDSKASKLEATTGEEANGAEFGS